MIEVHGLMQNGPEWDQLGLIGSASKSKAPGIIGAFCKMIRALQGASPTRRALAIQPGKPFHGPMSNLYVTI